MKEKTVGIIGKSGSGKTRDILFKEVQNIISNRENMIISDERLEYYNYFGQLLKDQGYRLEVINFKDPMKSSGWNPLGYISYLYNNDKTDKAIELLEKMGKLIFDDRETNSDPFWTNMATSYFIGIVLILLKISKEEKDPHAIDFYSILSVMLDGEKEYKESTYLKEYISKLSSLDPIYVALSPIVFAPNETRGSIISVVKSKINTIFMRPQILNMFYNESMNIEHLTDNSYGKLAVFVINYKPMNRMTNVFIEQAFSAVSDNNQKMNFILDGFDELPKVNGIDEMINIANHSNNNIKLYVTSTSKEKILDKYNEAEFSNIEKVIELTNKIEMLLEDNEYELPKLVEHKVEYFDFKKYFD